MSAQERLYGGFYNSQPYGPANLGGLGNGGHVINFPAALLDIGTVGQAVGQQASDAAAAAMAAAGAAAAASGSATTAGAQAGLANTHRQAAEAAAASVDPASFVQKSGGAMSGLLTVGTTPAFGRVRLQPGSGEFSGILELLAPSGARTGYLIASDSRNYLQSEGVGWDINGGLRIDGAVPFTVNNDGSGSGLDADLLRGLVPNVGAVPSTIPERDGNGFLHAQGLSIAPGAFQNIYWGSNEASLGARGGSLGLNVPLYLDSGLSASTVTERSDRRLKRAIRYVEGSGLRLRPALYVLKATGEERLGFVAQDVAEACPLAVRHPEEPGGMLELSPMALVAHLAAQLNDALDRIEALEGAAR